VIRVHAMPRLHVYGSEPREEIVPEDIDATSAAVSAHGDLLLTRVEFREIRDPNNLAAPPRIERSNDQFVAFIAAGYWSRADNLELADDA